jgi:N-acetylneuraminic acid mutarotase
MMRWRQWFFGFLLVGFTSVSSFAQVTLYWEQATDSAPWGNRRGHTTVSFQDKLWLIGGNYSSEVWYSPDGESWTLATASAPWIGREDHTSVVFDGKMWVIGGYYGEWTWVPLNDVWYSSNGVDWIQATASAPWYARLGHTSVVFDNKMWVIGGLHMGDLGSESLNDVWYSTNGAQWYQATSSGPWAARMRHSSVTHDGKMWVIFGTVGYTDHVEFREDVWCSTNGTAWTRTTDSGDQRYGHSSVVYGGRMWVLGGSSSPLPGEDDYYVRSSLDGVDWVGNGESPPGAPWGYRIGHSCVVHDGKIWLLGGSSNDVWCAGINPPPVTAVADWEARYR